MSEYRVETTDEWSYVVGPCGALCSCPSSVDAERIARALSALDALDQSVEPMALGSSEVRGSSRAANPLQKAVEAGWDDGVRFASEVLRSQVFPRDSARAACVDRVLAALCLPSPPEAD